LDAAGLAELEKLPQSTEALMAFWRGLEPGWRLFEETQRPPKVSVDPKTGAYRVRADRPPSATSQSRAAQAR
jgi:murein L,D-transpeptidase YafK